MNARFGIAGGGRSRSRAGVVVQLIYVTVILRAAYRSQLLQKTWRLSGLARARDIGIACESI